MNKNYFVNVIFKLIKSHEISVRELIGNNFQEWA